MAAGGSGGLSFPGVGNGVCGNSAPSNRGGASSYNYSGGAAASPSIGGPGNQAAASSVSSAPGASPPAGPPPPALLHREPVYNWQATKTTVRERFTFLFNNEVLSDVHFLVGKGLGSQRIPAHRFVLAVGSAVFDAMFNGGMATTSTEIELPDVEPAAFLALLKFLYSDEVQIGPETVMTTLYTAKKYAVPALEAHCVEFLKKNLRADNAFMLLTQARLFDEPQLASLCLENIDKNTSDAINAEGFTDIDLGNLLAPRILFSVYFAKLKNGSRYSDIRPGRQDSSYVLLYVLGKYDNTTVQQRIYKWVFINAVSSSYTKYVIQV
ncbi:hypothetical protein FKM82_014875 [Ascaphus truei]